MVSTITPSFCHELIEPCFLPCWSKHCPEEQVHIHPDEQPSNLTCVLSLFELHEPHCNWIDKPYTKQLSTSLCLAVLIWQAISLDCCVSNTLVSWCCIKSLWLWCLHLCAMACWGPVMIEFGCNCTKTWCLQCLLSAACNSPHIVHMTLIAHGWGTIATEMTLANNCFSFWQIGVQGCLSSPHKSTCTPCSVFRTFFNHFPLAIGNTCSRQWSGSPADSRPLPALVIDHIRRALP